MKLLEKKLVEVLVQQQKMLLQLLASGNALAKQHQLESATRLKSPENA